MTLRQSQIKFVDPEDDSAENREIVALVQERSRSLPSQDIDLDQAARSLGYDLVKLNSAP